MMLAWLMLQAAVADPVIAPPRRVPDSGPQSGACAQPAADAQGDAAIVVCGAGPGRHRLRPVPERYSATPEALPRAETSILGGRARIAAEGETGGVGGFVSNRGLVRLKIPF